MNYKIVEVEGIGPVYAEKLSDALKVTLSDEEVKNLTDEAMKTGIRQQGSWEPQQRECTYG